MDKPLLIYNLFPRIAGTFTDWEEHVKRAKKLGFTAIFINPIHYPGFSGSLYAVKDYYAINPMFVDKDSKLPPMEQFKKFVNFVNDMDMDLIMDLVINHTARDSILAEKHPEWFKHDENGDFVSPGAWDDKQGKMVIWGDLIEVDNEHAENREELWNYWLDLVRYYSKMGIKGFRCDAAYQVPSDLWNFLISNSKKEFPEIYFLAETLGCTPEESVETAKSGFEYIFNSSKYWNFYDYWCIEQYNLFKNYTKTISFSESHDTPRLSFELNNNLNAIKLKYTFSIIFSTGTLVPIGFEFGFQKKLDVVNMTPDDWEKINYDISEFITINNNLKHQYKVFNEDNDIYLIDNNNPHILTFMKVASDKSQKAFIILNKDFYNYQYIKFDNLFDVFGSQNVIKDISPEFALDFIPSNFEYNLRPAQIIILLQEG